MRRSAALVFSLSFAVLLWNAQCSSGGGGGGGDDEAGGGAAGGEPTDDDNGQGGFGGGDAPPPEGGAGGGDQPPPEGGMGGESPPPEGGMGGGGNEPPPPAGMGGSEPQPGGSTPLPAGQYCPDQGNCKIMSLGDGIAEGVGVTGGYRTSLASKLKGHMKNAFEFVGALGSGANNKHDGKADLNAAGLTATAEAQVKAQSPHIVILNIGNEDVEQSQQSGLATRIKQVVDKIRAAAPGAYIVVSSLSRSRNSGFNTRAIAVDSQISTAVTSWKYANVKFAKASWFNKDIDFPKLDDVDSRNTTTNSYYPSTLGYSRLSDSYDAAIWRLLKN